MQLALAAAAAAAAAAAPAAAAAAAPTVRVLIQTASFMQPQGDGGAPCANATAAGCTGGFALLAQRLREEAVGAESAVRVLGFEDLLMSRIVLYHPSGAELNRLLWERAGADAVAVGSPQPFTSFVDDNERVMRGFRPLPVISNLPFDAADADLMRFDGVTGRHALVRAGRWVVGLSSYLGPHSWRPMEPAAVVAPVVSAELRARGADVVVALCSGVAAAWRESCADLAGRGPDVIVQPLCTAGCGPGGQPALQNGSWLVSGALNTSSPAWALQVLDFVQSVTSDGLVPAGLRVVDLAVPLSLSAQQSTAYRADVAWLQQHLNLAARSDPEVGQAAAPMPSPVAADAAGVTDRACLRDSCPLGVLVNSALRGRFPDADVLWLNGGALQKGWGEGPIKLSDLYGALPFDMPVCRFLATASELWTNLVAALGAVGPDGEVRDDAAVPGRFPITEGLRYAFDPQRESGGRVVLFELRDTDTGRWEPASRKRYYSVVSNRYLCDGGDGYTFRTRNRTDLQATVQNILANFLGSSGPVSPAQGDPLQAPGDPRSSVSLAPATLSDCAAGEVYLPQWELCEPCPSGVPDASTLSCVPAPDLASDTDEGIWMWLMIAASIVAFVVVAGAVLKVIRDRQAVAQLYDDTDVALGCAEAIADMRLEEQLEFLQGNPNPNRIQMAFQRIIHTMLEYRSYLPTTLFPNSGCTPTTEKQANYAVGGRLPRRDSGMLGRLQRKDSGIDPAAQRCATATAEDGEPRLPQLASEKTRAALRCVVAQGQRSKQGSEVDALMTNLLLKSVQSNDMHTRWCVLRCWEPPASVKQRLNFVIGAHRGAETPPGRSPLQLNTIAAFAAGKDDEVMSPHGVGLSLLQFGGAQARTPVDETCLSHNFRPHGAADAVEASCETPLKAIRKGAEKPPHRFGDGAADTETAITAIGYFPHDYEPPSADDAVLSLADWHCPKGITYWPSQAIHDLLADYAVCCHANPPEDAAALYAYTAEAHHTAVWAVWRNSSWQSCPDFDYCLTELGGLELTKEHMDEAGVDATAEDEEDEDSSRRRGVLERLQDEWIATAVVSTQFGLRLYSAGSARFLRYENVQAGTPETSPLRDVVLWAPSPDSIVSGYSAFCCNPDADSPPPTPGVLEFISSRDFRVTVERKGWRSVPLERAPLRQLRELCMAQKNQQRPTDQLCRAAETIFFSADGLDGHGPSSADMQKALPLVYRAKCPAALPSPGQIAHATELNVLRWQGRWMLLALTGPPRCAAVLGTTDSDSEDDDCGEAAIEMLYRVDSALPDQPFQVMNAAMRHQQAGRFDAELRFQQHGDRRMLTARQPDRPPPAPAAALFTEPSPTVQAGVAPHSMHRSRRPSASSVSALPGRRGSQQLLLALTAAWSDGAWQLTVGDGFSKALHQAELAVQAWGLPQCRALIWRLQACLRSIPGGSSHSRRRKNYRGLAGVALDRGIYTRNNVVVFGAFTSASDDQGVATSFSEGAGGAAVFTMFGSTGRRVAQWSRFGREKEVLYPPNTFHLVTDALSAEHAAILDKRQIQLFDLRELTEAQAAQHLAKEGALEISRTYPSALQQAEQAAQQAENGDWFGAARTLLSELRPGGTDGAFRRARALLPEEGVAVLALTFDSPAGPEVGAGIDSAAWNAFFLRVENKGKGSGAHILATHVGAMLVLVTADDCGGELNRAMLAVLNMATELLYELEGHRSPQEMSSPRGADTLPEASPRTADAQGGPLSLSVATACLDVPPHKSGRTTPFQRDSLPDTLMHPRADTLVTGAYNHAADERSFRVYGGVSVGTVHRGFAGSDKQRVEIADGPPVRRARRMAAYARRFGVREALIDATCATAAAQEGLNVCTLDLVRDSGTSGERQRLLCAAGPSGPLSGGVAETVDAAWQAVLRCADEGSKDSTREMEEAIAAVPRSSHRACAALRAAASCPVTYCVELGCEL
eukprot:TRINITY_DN7842_c1_g1_i1.p1 TRINITY_DN7842_c1_g1~~TRINITY_DN7842_c1_g1_i1.p1  ORF type:complete len:1946 (+),score=450.44 TRINITY_DN7842_c1_g1_i1:104-5941(+)